MSISEPVSFNGGPDDGGCRTRGRRREPDPRDYQPVCHRCGRDCIAVHSLADVGIFCSVACRSKATSAMQKASA